MDDDTTLEVIDEPIVPATNIEPDLGNEPFEVVEDNAEPTAEELKAQLAEQKAQLEALKQNADLSTGMQQGFQTLAQQLQAQQQPSYDNLPGLPPAPESNPAPQQQYALPKKEEFEKEFFTNPYDAMQKMLAPVVGAQNSTFNSQMNEMNKMISKNQAYMNEANKEILSKYGNEVEVYASRLQSNDPWGDAIKQVTMNHFNDIMAEKAKTAEERAIEAYKAELEKGKQSQPSPVGTTNMGNTTNPGPAKVKITKAEMDKVKEMTMLKFGPNSPASVELQMYEYMKDNGML